MSTKKQQITWRRSQVLELTSKGYSQSDIVRVLQIDKSVICRDLAFLRQQSKQNIRRYIDERLPEEYEKCLVGLTAILREAWNMSQQALQEREKIQALSLAKECYSMKLELLTNATVVDDAIRFVAGKESGGKSKTDPYVIIEKEKQQQYDNTNKREQKTESNNFTTDTLNHVF
jgi:hypothetical protein